MSASEVQEYIRAENLCKSCCGSTALDGVSITALREEICCVFGPSGSGKSTLLRLLAGIEAPDSGSLTRSDGSPAISFAEPALDDSLTPMEILNLHAALYGIPRRKRRGVIREMILLLDLEEARDSRVCALSSGLRKQVELARTLISPSATLLLDEPMSGLDTIVRERVWNHLMMLKSIEHRTIIIATARPEDAELCDRITVLNKGRVLAEGTVSRLRSMIGPEAVVIKPLGSRKHGARGTWGDKRAITMAEQDGSLVVEMSADSRPAELVREISGQAAAVRLRPKGLDVVLEELIARSDRHGDAGEGS